MSFTDWSIAEWFNHNPHLSEETSGAAGVWGSPKESYLSIHFSVSNAVLSRVYASVAYYSGKLHGFQQNNDDKLETRKSL